MPASLGNLCGERAKRKGPFPKDIRSLSESDYNILIL